MTVPTMILGNDGRLTSYLSQGSTSGGIVKMADYDPNRIFVAFNIFNVNSFFGGTLALGSPNSALMVSIPSVVNVRSDSRWWSIDDIGEAVCGEIWAIGVALSGIQPSIVMTKCSCGRK
jgi:hypothetical protein